MRWCESTTSHEWREQAWADGRWAVDDEQVAIVAMC
jgi:hypothetical protein